MPDEVEQVAVLPGRGVGPFPRYAGSVEADEERAAASAVQIAGDPVAALLAAVRQVAPADGFGVGERERGGDAGGGRPRSSVLEGFVHAGLLPIRAGARYRPPPPQRPSRGPPRRASCHLLPPCGRPIPAGLLSGRRRRACAPRIARARRPNGSRSGSAAEKRPAPKCRPGGEGGNETMTTDR